MKGIILILFMFLSVIGYGQKLISGSLDFLKGEKELEINFDYSKMLIMNNTEEDFLYLKTDQKGEEWRVYWNKEVKKSLKFDFVSEFNGKSALHASYKDNPKANYIATVYILTVDSNGKTGSEVVFTQRGSGTILAKIKLNGNGGRFGTLENLMGDAYKRSGENLAKFLRKSIKK